jgi:hypothetical protein
VCRAFLESMEKTGLGCEVICCCACFIIDPCACVERVHSQRFVSAVDSQMFPPKSSLSRKHCCCHQQQ